MAQIDVAADVEQIRSMVAKYFPIYDVKVTYEAVTLLVSPNKGTLDANFDSLRKEMKAQNLIPLINYSGGEYAISVIRQPEMRKRGSWVNRILLVITFFTTALAGMVLWADYSGAASLYTVDNFVFGALFFAIPLMAILGVHELSHYLAAKRHGVEASLPFFIPSIPPFGTFGAFISMRDPMPSRKALVDIGIAGPLGGLAVTIPVAIIGLILTAAGPTVSGPLTDGGVLAINIQPLYQLLSVLVPSAADKAIHPTAFAAWVGFLVTAINLLPIGQLDGGHVARGLLGDKARYLGYATFGVLVVLALFYDGWLLFALLVFLIGLRHPAPLNDISKLPLKTAVVGCLGFVVLLSTFVPQPMVTLYPDHAFTIDVAGDNNTNVSPGAVILYQLAINNTGDNVNNEVRLSINGFPGSWNAYLYESNGTSDNATYDLTLSIPYQSNASVTLELHVPAGEAIPSSRDLILKAVSSDQTTDIVLTVNVA